MLAGSSQAPHLPRPPKGFSKRAVSTRALISAYAASMSLPSAAAFVAVPGLSVRWRMYVPVPGNQRA